MSKQLNIATAIAEKQTERQKKCKHKFISVPAFDHENDRIYHFGVCLRCGLKTE
jgi:hypothetical protein